MIARPAIEDELEDRGNGYDATVSGVLHPNGTKIASTHNGFLAAATKAVIAELTATAERQAA